MSNQQKKNEVLCALKGGHKWAWGPTKTGPDKTSTIYKCMYCGQWWADKYGQTMQDYQNET